MSLNYGQVLNLTESSYIDYSIRLDGSYALLLIRANSELIFEMCERLSKTLGLELNIHEACL